MRLSLYSHAGSIAWMCSCCGYTPTPDVAHTHTNTNRRDTNRVSGDIGRRLVWASDLPNLSAAEPCLYQIGPKKNLHLMCGRLNARAACTESQAPCQSKHPEIILRGASLSFEKEVNTNMRWTPRPPKKRTLKQRRWLLLSHRSLTVRRLFIQPGSLAHNILISSAPWDKSYYKSPRSPWLASVFPTMTDKQTRAQRRAQSASDGVWGQILAQPLLDPSSRHALEMIFRQVLQRQSANSVSKRTVTHTWTAHLRSRSREQGIDKATLIRSGSKWRRQWAEEEIWLGARCKDGSQVGCIMISEVLPVGFRLTACRPTMEGSSGQKYHVSQREEED